MLSCAFPFAEWGHNCVPECRARSHSAAPAQAGARSSRASCEQEFLPCPNKEPCGTSVLAWGAGTRPALTLTTPFVSIFSLFHPFLFILGIAFHLLLAVCLGRSPEQCKGCKTTMNTALFCNEEHNCVPSLLLSILCFKEVCTSAPAACFVLVLVSHTVFSHVLHRKSLPMFCSLTLIKIPTAGFVWTSTCALPVPC